MTDAESSEGGNHDKQIQTMVLSPDHEFDVGLVIRHKSDGLAAKVGLTFEQIAMLHHEFEEVLELVDGEFEIKETVLEEARTEERGFE